MYAVHDSRRRATLLDGTPLSFSIIRQVSFFASSSHSLCNNSQTNPSRHFFFFSSKKPTQPVASEQYIFKVPFLQISSLFCFSRLENNLNMLSFIRYVLSMFLVQQMLRSYEVFILGHLGCPTFRVGTLLKL